MEIATYILLFIAVVTSFMGVIIMTDIGQIINIKKSIIVAYFKNSRLIMSVSFMFLLAGLFIAYQNTIIDTLWIAVIFFIWLVFIISSKYLTPYFLFRAKQHSAKYVPIKNVKGYLKDDDRVLVVDYNGVQKAYPPEYIWQAHIFGGDFGGENVILTYCVMTNLASPYINNLNGKKINLKVLAQTNNNLLLWDTESDEIIQQITQKCEFSQQKLEPLPILEMTLRGYKKLFPEGTVLYNKWTTPLEKIVSLIFSTEKTWHGDKWMFNTANLDDKRLPSKEHIIGIRDDHNNKELAITKPYIKSRGILNLSVGKKPFVIFYSPEYETIVCYSRLVDGQEVNIKDIDIHGQTPEYGQLKRMYIYNSVLWAVWAHYYPETKVLND